MLCLHPLVFQHQHQECLGRLSISSRRAARSHPDQPLLSRICMDFLQTAFSNLSRFPRQIFLYRGRTNSLRRRNCWKFREHFAVDFVQTSRLLARLILLSLCRSVRSEIRMQTYSQRYCFQRTTLQTGLSVKLRKPGCFCREVLTHKTLAVVHRLTHTPPRHANQEVENTRRTLQSHPQVSPQVKSHGGIFAQIWLYPLLEEVHRKCSPRRFQQILKSHY
mmetsp:Transcript_8601/g.27613  ORF Transcript_8601/g.27613 Transcript_8601/m.27613 type:complete len:220 (-) Transcript_8601:2529-3188(-)